MAQGEQSINVDLIDKVAAEMAAEQSGENIEVSLITCYPGPEIFELCGHSAIRIRTAESDSVWNYGLFNFSEPNFVYRFCKGQTDYHMGGYPFEWFLPEYVNRGSKVVEQHLNLTQGEAFKLRKMLRDEQLRDHGKYRYNYVLDNCATRIYERIDQATNDHVIYPDTTSYRSFRNEMRSYHRDYPWYQFGIDVALGSGIDRPLTSRQDMFVPVEFSRKAAVAHFSDGRPLVKAETILYPGRDGATLPPTPFHLTPLFWALILMAVSFAVAGIDLYRGTITRWYYAIFFSILGIAGCIVAFLVFFSEHYATSPNALILWLNPLQFVVPALMWSRKTRPVVTAWMIASGAVLICLMIAWPMQSQSANAALFPLIAATIALQAVWAINSLRGVVYTSASTASSKAKSKSKKGAKTKKYKTK